LKRLCGFLLFGFLLVAFPAFAGLPLGQDAIDFELKDPSGKSFHLSDFRGRPIILKIATTWCPTCKEQSGEFAKLGDYLRDNEVVVVEVFIQEKPGKVSSYLEKYRYPMTFVPLIDEGAVSNRYGVYLIPRVILIDRDFKVRRDGNILHRDELMDALAPLVAKK